MKALIAMSGGVDSAVSAYLMKKEGFECAGATMLLAERTEDVCGAIKDVEDAKKVAEKVGIPHFTYDFKVAFKKNVIYEFVFSYEKGETPNPCIECNKTMKFGALFDISKQDGFDVFVTGHYARIEKVGDRWALKKGKDEKKDQSYFLYGIKRENLPYIRFPLGDLTKKTVREIAEENGFVNAKKNESQDICFVPDGDYVKVIEGITAKKYKKGDFADLYGNILGEHKGIIGYTIGQRKGLGLALKEPMYVTKLDMENNRVILGTNEDLFSKELTAYGFNWLKYDTAPKEMRVKAKIRSGQKEQWATAYAIENDCVRVVFDEPQRAITSGQSVVLYDDDEVVGGGKIR